MNMDTPKAEPDVIDLDLLEGLPDLPPGVTPESLSGRFATPAPAAPAAVAPQRPTTKLPASHAAMQAPPLAMPHASAPEAKEAAPQQPVEQLAATHATMPAPSAAVTYTSASRGLEAAPQQLPEQQPPPPHALSGLKQEAGPVPAADVKPEEGKVCHVSCPSAFKPPVTCGSMVNLLVI